mmetsp:Transcript_3677/g.7036  ORF Transcript_3677/g.7036 Transcript_3677/m.7036 type:complete len:112 (-) Transcript_3677:133-468(-)
MCSNTVRCIPESFHGMIHTGANPPRPMAAVTSSQDMKVKARPVWESGPSHWISPVIIPSFLSKNRTCNDGRAPRAIRVIPGNLTVLQYARNPPIHMHETPDPAFAWETRER